MGFFFSSRRRHTRFDCDWSSDVCSSDLGRGNSVVVVFLTSGQKGTFDPAMSSTSLGRIRRREAAEAYRSLGFPDARLIWLGYQDGELDFASPRELRIKLTHLIRR